MYHKHEHTLPNCWWKSVTMMFGCDKCEIAHVSALTNTNKEKPMQPQTSSLQHVRTIGVDDEEGRLCVRKRCVLVINET